MIGTIDIRVHAANPNLPLKPMFAFKDSPSSLRILDVPKSIGTWEITNVYLAVEYPNGANVVKEATRNGNVWIATIQGTSTTGTVKNGLQVIADGIDEDGNQVEGYALGIGDVLIQDRDSTISPEISSYYVKYYDDIPSTPAKGTVIVDGGTVKFYDGANWIYTDTSDFATKQELNVVTANVQTLSNALSGKRDYSDITWKYTMANDDVMYGIQKFYVTRNAAGQEDQSYDMTSFTPSNHTWTDATVENSLKVRALARNSFLLLSSNDTEIGTFYRSSDTNTQWLITQDEDGVQAEYTIIAWKRADDKFAMNSELSKVVNLSGTFFTSSLLSNSSFSFNVVVK